MAKCVSVGIDKNKLPDYYNLLQNAKGVKAINETPEQVKARLIYRINQANGGDDL